ncbi:MAG TPA: multidrug effflux MFS transporter [Burkholderiaceae bacterium]|nr:multidrug effflux MFS transporter [Burkholderiaceae bacterium]
MSSSPTPTTQEADPLSSTVPAPLMSELKVTLIGALLIAVGPVSMVLYTPALPDIVRYFGTTGAMVQMTVTLYFGGFALTQLICGPISDAIGRRPVILTFMSIYLVSCIMVLLAESIEVMLAARFLQGVGAAAGMAIARAIVRDVFTDARAVRIMNLMGLFIAIAPAAAPALGGLTIEFAPWKTLFALMAIMGVGVIGVTIFSLRETITRDVSRLRPRALLASYRTLLTTPYFMLASLVVALSIGAVYMLATVLPFILMVRVGLSPTAYGLSQILQAGAYILGALAVQTLLPRRGADALVPIGLAVVIAGCIALVALIALFGPTFLTVMLPIAVYSFGIAFIMPSMLTNSLMPFPSMAGAASALTAFLQMAAGLISSALAAAFANPTVSLAVLMPAMGVASALCWLYWRRLPAPGPTIKT